MPSICQGCGFGLGASLAFTQGRERRRVRRRVNGKRKKGKSLRIWRGFLGMVSGQNKLTWGSVSEFWNT
jgi:hypothetical protein